MNVEVGVQSIIKLYVIIFSYHDYNSYVEHSMKNVIEIDLFLFGSQASMV